MRLTREERGMLYRLAGRHSDIGFIRGHMLREFGRAPSREVIAEAQKGLNAYKSRNSSSHKRSCAAGQHKNYARKHAEEVA